MISDKNGIQ